MLRTSLIMILISTAVLAQEYQPKPDLYFTKFSHDFGTIEKGEKVSVNFEFKNAGDGELEISDVKASCGCTTATPEKLNYAPGEVGMIPVTFDSTRFNGQITKTINVTSNDPDNPRTQLRITGNVLSEVVNDPVSLAISNIRRTEKVSRAFYVKTESLDRLEITDLAATFDFLKLTQERVDDKNIKVVVSFDGATLPQDRDIYQGHITYKTNGVKIPEGKLSVFIRVMKPVRARPGSVYFFSTPKGQAREMLVTLYTEEGVDLKLGKIESSEKFITVEKMEGNQIKISLSADAEVGKFNGKVTIDTNVPEQPVLTISVRGSVI